MNSLMKLINSFRNSTPNLQATLASGDYVEAKQTKTGAGGRIRLEIIQALNGRVLEIYSRPNPRSDWECELYIVKDDEALADAVATALVLKGGV